MAIIGSREASLLIGEALTALRLPIALDLFVVDERLDRTVSLKGSVRVIGGFGSEDRVDRFDLSARYDAVVYGFDAHDAPHLMRAFAHSADRAANHRRSSSSFPNEFELGDVRRGPGKGGGDVALAATVATTIASFLRSSSDSPRGWSAADPARWIETQYPAAVILDADHAAAVSALDVPQPMPADNASTAA